jgi:hypothetical protein
MDALLARFTMSTAPPPHRGVTAVKVTLADISGTELAALIAATYGVPRTASDSRRRNPSRCTF